MPLTGKRILVTSPGRKGKEFATKLQVLGAQAPLVPVMQINDPDSWEKFDQALAKLSDYNWLFFASTNAVTFFVKRISHHYGLNWHSLESGKEVLNSAIIAKLPPIAVIGEKTAEIAISYGLKPQYCPTIFLAEDFVEQFPGYPDQLSNTNILWPRTNIGRDLILEKLLAGGAKIDVVPAYKTDLPDNIADLSQQLHALINDKNLSAITIGSKQTAINLAKMLCLNKTPNDISRNLLSSAILTIDDISQLQTLLANILIVTIGPEASAGALNYLGKVNLEAKPHTVDGMINALIEYYR